MAGALMYLAQISRYDILYAVNQLVRAMSKPSKAHMGAAKHVLRYLVGSVIFPTTYKRGGFKLTTYTDANWDSRQREVDLGVHRDSRQRPDQLQRGTKSNRSIDHGGGARGSCHRDEGVTLLKKHDDGIGFHGGILEFFCLRRQHIGVARGGKQDL